MKIALNFKKGHSDYLDDVKMLHFSEDGTYITYYHLENFTTVYVKDLNHIAYDTFCNGVEYLNYPSFTQKGE